MNDEKLKPCPFCGGEAEIMAYRVLFGRPDYWVKCYMCGATTEMKKSGRIAAMLWNKRAQ